MQGIKGREIILKCSFYLLKNKCTTFKETGRRVKGKKLVTETAIHYDFQRKGTHTSHNFKAMLKQSDLKTFRNSYMEESHEEKEEHVVKTEEGRNMARGREWSKRRRGREMKVRV